MPLLADVPDLPGHSGEGVADQLVDGLRPGDHHDSGRIAGVLRRHEDRRMKKPDARARHVRQPHCGSLRRGGRMIDDDGACPQPWNERVRDALHDIVVGQRHVDALGAGHRIGRRSGHSCAEPLERARFRFGAVPDRHRVAAPEHGFDHAAPEQARSDICDVRHADPPDTI